MGSGRRHRRLSGRGPRTAGPPTDDPLDGRAPSFGAVFVGGSSERMGRDKALPVARRGRRDHDARRPRRRAAVRFRERVEVAVGAPDLLPGSAGRPSGRRRYRLPRRAARRAGAPRTPASTASSRSPATCRSWSPVTRGARRASTGRTRRCGSWTAATSPVRRLPDDLRRSGAAGVRRGSAAHGRDLRGERRTVARCGSIDPAEENSARRLVNVNTRTDYDRAPTAARAAPGGPEGRARRPE